MWPTIGAAAGDTLMNNMEDEAYNFIEKMSLNNYQWSNEIRQPKRVGGELELDALTLVSAKVDVMTQRLDRLNANVASSTGPTPSCEICGSIDPLTVTCQVRSPFAQDTGDQVNSVNSFTLRLTNDPYFNTYNSGWRITLISHIGLTLP